MVGTLSLVFDGLGELVCKSQQYVNAMHLNMYCVFDIAVRIYFCVRDRLRYRNFLLCCKEKFGSQYVAIKSTMVIIVYHIIVRRFPFPAVVVVIFVAVVVVVVVFILVAVVITVVSGGNIIARFRWLG